LGTATTTSRGPFLSIVRMDENHPPCLRHNQWHLPLVAITCARARHGETEFILISSMVHWYRQMSSVPWLVTGQGGSGSKIFGLPQLVGHRLVGTSPLPLRALYLTTYWSLSLNKRLVTRVLCPIIILHTWHKVIQQSKGLLTSSCSHGEGEPTHLLVPLQGSGDFWAQPAKIHPFVTSTGFFQDLTGCKLVAIHLDRPIYNIIFPSAG
jgi:hypothetical protein